MSSSLQQTHPEKLCKCHLTRVFFSFNSSVLGPVVIYLSIFICVKIGVLDIDIHVSSTDQNTTAFKEVAIIRHPRVGEYAFGFITSTVILQVLLSYDVHYIAKG